MEKTKYRDLIMRYLTALDPNQVITTEQVAQYVAEQLQLETATGKKTGNVNMARLEKEGEIVRLTKGIYCRKVKTAFGYYTPDKETPVSYTHLDPGDDRIVEDEGQSRQEQRAEDDSDDDLHSVRDIKIAALVGERRAGAKDEAVGVVADAAGKLLHENTS